MVLLWKHLPGLEIPLRIPRVVLAITFRYVVVELDANVENAAMHHSVRGLRQIGYFFSHNSTMGD
jgi:hypothetical protein